jgi:DNA-directed RNA polymerase specialized sigma24 family protein
MLETALRDHFQELYRLVYRLALSDEQREGLLHDAVRLAGPLCESLAPRAALLRGVADALQRCQRGAAQLTFETLDELLRDAPTDPDALARMGDDDREGLLWQLQQGCLTATITCLPPGERVAFVLLDVLGEPPDSAAELLGIKTSALRVRASRARNKIVNYLAPRCGHVDPRNPCQCPSRLGVALDRGFVAPVGGRRVTLRPPPFEAQRPTHEPLAVFRALPDPDAPPRVLEELLELAR